MPVLFSTQDFDLVVAKATLIVTADNQSRPYGSGNPALTFSYSGFVGSDTEAVLDSQKPHTATTAINSTNAGDVAITLSADPDNNYAYDLHNGVLTITKVTLQATADNKTRPYGSADVQYTISYSGFVNGDTDASLAATRPTANTQTPAVDVGTYAIKVTGGTDTNYNFNGVDGSLIVTPVTLTITADAQSKTYGDVNPSLTFSYAGFVNGDVTIDTPPSISVTGVDKTTPVGSYDIKLAGGSDNNYNLALNNGTLTITKAPLTITAQNQSRPYGSSNPTLTVTYSGFVNNETQNTPGLFTHALDVTTAPSTATVGTYGIIPSAATADNYNISFTQGTLTITKAVLTATADNQTRSYGALNPAFTISYTGFLNGDGPLSITPGTGSSPTGTSGAALEPMQSNQTKTNQQPTIRLLTLTAYLLSRKLR
ncbi:MAG: MBG domain-containing protein [Bacteroidota bacterium]